MTGYQHNVELCRRRVAPLEAVSRTTISCKSACLPCGLVTRPKSRCRKKPVRCELGPREDQEEKTGCTTTAGKKFWKTHPLLHAGLVFVFLTVPRYSSPGQVLKTLQRESGIVRWLDVERRSGEARGGLRRSADQPEKLPIDDR